MANEKEITIIPPAEKYDNHIKIINSNLIKIGKTERFLLK